jgi:predicted DNA-binding transcriptional regulator YafY
VIEKKDHFIVELKIIPTYELTMLIMGWGPNVEVIQPLSLKKEILRLHQECVEKVKAD